MVDGSAEWSVSLQFALESNFLSGARYIKHTDYHFLRNIGISAVIAT